MKFNRAVYLRIKNCGNCDKGERLFRKEIENGHLEVEDYESYGKKHYRELEALDIQNFPTIIIETETGLCEVDIENLEIKKCTRENRYEGR